MGTTHQDIEINAPVDTVWNAIRDFHDMGWAPNVITSVEKVGDAPGEGARVEWTSIWEKNDEAGHEFCHPIYLALLGDMKASLE